MTYVDPNADPNDQSPKPLREENKRLKKELKEERAKTERLAQLERERNFLHAGIPLDDKRAAYFVAGYQGEQTPEAIKAEWQATFGNPPSGEQGHGQGLEQNPQVQEELAQLAKISETTSAGYPNLPADRLAERDKKLAALSPTDPRTPEKFDAIMHEYGGRFGSMIG